MAAPPGPVSGEAAAARRREAGRGRGKAGRGRVGGAGWVWWRMPGGAITAGLEAVAPTARSQPDQSTPRAPLRVAPFLPSMEGHRPTPHGNRRAVGGMLRA